MAGIPRLHVGLHRFQTHRRHHGRDGANFAYQEIVQLLTESPTIEVIPHDVRALFADDVAAYRALSQCDVVVATVGPHAYIYFYLRERLGLRFRIIRDVRTALWNGYLLQETLVAPYLRPDDAVVYSTAYSRDLFRAVIPTVPRESQHVCYPLMHWFPSPPPARVARGGRDGPVRIGYVGRLTADKNFPQALDLIAALERRCPGRFRLCAVGEGQPPFGTPDAAQRLGPACRAYEWVPPVHHDEIWHYYAGFDVLFFPSTSTLETFGRVLVEATYAQVPVLASSHGSCSELLAPTALVSTFYDTTRTFTTHFAAPLGQVDIAEATERLINGPPVPLSYEHEPYYDDAARFVAMVVHGNEADPEPRRAGTAYQAAFISRLRIRDLAVARTSAEAGRAITGLRARFDALHRRNPAYALALLELLIRSRYRRKTLQFIGRSLRLGEDFTNIGGVDLEFSHLLRFYPSFQLAPLQAMSRGLDTAERGRTR